MSDMAVEFPLTGGSGDTSLKNLKSAKELTAHASSLKNKRSGYERDWRLNLAFYKGNQYSWYNPATKQIQSLPMDGEAPRYRVRLVSNQIVSGCQSLLAKFTKTKPKIFASPGSGDAAELKAAQLSESLLDFWWGEMGLDFKLEEALLWSIIAGQGYWKITWDAQAGKQARFLLDPNGRPIVDTALQDQFKGQLKQYGIEPQEKVVYLGDIKVEPLSPFQVMVDPSKPNFEDAQFAYCQHYLTPDEVEGRWNKKVSADAIGADEDSMLPMDYPTLMNAGKSLVRVMTGYFRPSPSLPNGRYVVFTSDKILEDSKWPYPFDMLPIVKFGGIRIPGQPYDQGIVTHARPLQKELNKTLSQIVEYKNLMVRPQWIAPVGSMRRAMSNEPGIVNEFVPIAGLQPEPVQNGNLPPYVFEHLKDISYRLQDMFGLTDVGEGRVPPNVEAGIAIDLLQEMSTDRLSPAIKLMEQSLAQAGQIMLSLAQTYYIEPRMVRIAGSGSTPQVKRFTKADIAGGVDVRVDVGSGLPRTRAGRQAMVMDLVKNNLMPMDKAYKYLELGDVKGAVAPWASDTDKAYREHEKMINGIPLNANEVAQTMEAIQQGQNPETGDPLPQDPNEANGVIYDLMYHASLQPGIADNNEIHIQEHSLFINSIEFEALPDDVQKRFVTHYGLTLDKMMKLRTMSGANDPKVNVSVRAAAGPTMLSELLKKSGVQVDPETIGMEPPMETWVTDSVDKPDQDTGPGGLDPQDPATAYIQDANARKAGAEADKAEYEAEAARRGDSGTG